MDIDSIKSYLDSGINMLPQVTVTFGSDTFTGFKGQLKASNKLAAQGVEKKAPIAFSVWLSQSNTSMPAEDDLVTIENVEYAVDSIAETAAYRRLDLKTMVTR